MMFDFKYNCSTSMRIPSPIYFDSYQSSIKKKHHTHPAGHGSTFQKETLVGARRIYYPRIFFVKSADSLIRRCFEDY